MSNLLANSNTQQLQGDISFNSKVQYSLSFSSVFGLYQLLREISVSVAAKCSTMFTS